MSNYTIEVPVNGEINVELELTDEVSPITKQHCCRSWLWSIASASCCLLLAVSLVFVIVAGAPLLNFRRPYGNYDSDLGFVTLSDPLTKYGYLYSNGETRFFYDVNGFGEPLRSTIRIEISPKSYLPPNKVPYVSVCVGTRFFQSQCQTVSQMPISFNIDGGTYCDRGYGGLSISTSQYDEKFYNLTFFIAVKASQADSSETWQCRSLQVGVIILAILITVALGICALFFCCSTCCRKKPKVKKLQINQIQNDQSNYRTI